jgi:hypothetical protein
MSEPIIRVKLQGRSWKIIDKGIYCFEVTVDGEVSELRIMEDVAFDLLGAFTMSGDKCLEILRLHRSELAKNLERKLHAVGFPGDRTMHVLSLNDIERTHPVARDKERSDRSEIDRASEEKPSRPAGVLH